METLQLDAPLDRSVYQNLPATNGIYIFKRNEEFLYIGKSVNIKARVLSHVENARSDAKEEAIVTQATALQTVITDSEFMALLLESRLIQTHHPKYNVIWRDDKSYLYIKVTGEPYPKIHAVRREHEPKARYFGPFSSSRQVESLLQNIRKIIPFCTQRTLSKKTCFYSKINLCDPCPNYIESLADETEKKRLRRIYRSNIRRVEAILDGNTEKILDSFYRDLKKAIREEDYERGIVLRKKVAVFEWLIHRRSFDQKGMEAYDRSQENRDALHLLLKRYFPGLPPLHRIECYDISNLMQKQATASMVVFIEGLADKKEYRRFKIKNPKLQSDFDMLDEALTRRFKNSWELPDLIVIDGGRPQIRRIMQVLEREGIAKPVIGIAKHPDRLVIGIPKMPVLRLRADEPGLKLVQSARDESHRFAKKYHVLLRDRELYNEF